MRKKGRSESKRIDINARSPSQKGKVAIYMFDKGDGKKGTKSEQCNEKCCVTKLKGNIDRHMCKNKLGKERDVSNMRTNINAVTKSTGKSRHL